MAIITAIIVPSTRDLCDNTAWLRMAKVRHTGARMVTQVIFSVRGLSLSLTAVDSVSPGVREHLTEPGLLCGCLALSNSCSLVQT